MLDDVQKNWLETLKTDAKRQESLDKREGQRLALLQQLAADRNKKQQMLTTGMDQQVSKGKKSSKMDVLDPEHHDQTKLFDLDEQRDGYRLANEDGSIEEWDPETGSQEHFEQLQAAGREVDRMAKLMEDAMTDEIGPDGLPTGKQVPLFSREEIQAEVYDPLLRQGLLAETFVPDKYSRTHEMLEGSFEAYAERLKADRKGKGRQFFNENLGLGKSLLNMTVVGVSTGVGMGKLDMDKPEDSQTKWDPKEGIKGIREGLGLQANSDGEWANLTDKTNQAMVFVAQGITLVTDEALDPALTIEGVVLEKRGLEDERKANAAQGKLAATVIGAVSMELGKTFNPLEIGLAASSAYGSKVSRGAVTTALKATPFEEDQAKAVGDLLGAALGDTLIAIDPLTGGKKAGAITTAAALLKTEFSKHLDKAKLAEAVTKVRPDEVSALVGKAAGMALNLAISKPVQVVFAGTAAKNAAQAAASELMTAEFEAEGNKGPVPAEMEKQHKNAHRDHLADWVKSGKGEWVCAVCQSAGKDDPEVFAGMLERRIAQLDRDTAILKWGTTLVGLGIDIACDFIAPLAIAGCALKMAKNLYEAGTRTVDFVNFCNKREGMWNAASAFSAPVSNFIHNAGVQQAHYYANAAFEAAKMIGAIIQCAGVMAAPAGAIVTAAAATTQAIEQVLYEANKRYELEKAWTTYKLALSRPANRKLGLIAMKKNPTLAKYAVAWGAFEKEDPLVIDFLDACGLTADTLKDPKANLDRVVAYLEKRMPDDNVVTGRSVKGPVAGWAPAKLELTAANWMTAKTRGESKGMVLAQDTRGLELALTNWEKEFPAWDKAAQTKPSSTLTTAQKDACGKLLEQLERGFGAYKTRLNEEAGGGVSVDMGNVIVNYRDLIGERREAVEKWVAV